MYYIGADLGTSSLKLMLVNKNGEILKSVNREYDVMFPKSGWSEQNPGDWWQAMVSGMDELTDGINKEEICGIGVGGQMHGLVILDDEDKFIRPAILWNDGRTEEQTAYLNETVGVDVLARETANMAFAGFTAPKILWLRENEPESFNKISKIMLPKDYINYRLTGVFATDYSDASGMLLLDVKNRCWSEEMMRICSVKREQLPKLFESYEVIGKVCPKALSELNLLGEVCVVAGAGDNAAAAIGTGTTGNGMCNISLGTSGTIFVSADEFKLPENNAVHSFCHADGTYHLMGVILSAASCNKWFCDKILNTVDYTKEAERVDEAKLGTNDVFFLPYLMGERSPMNDTNATGVFIGLRPDNKREDIYLAVLEGVAFALRDNLELIKGCGLKVRRSCLCGGGAKSKLWRKILANVLNISLDIPEYEEGPGYGAAMLAMVGTGEYDSIKSCRDKFVKIKETVEPDARLAKLYDEKYKKYTKIYPALKELYKDMNE